MAFLLGWLVPATGPHAAPQRGDDPRRGWHFYDDAPKARPMPPKPPASVNEPRHEIVRYKALQKAVEEARVVAVMAPTVENVRAYLDLEARILADASRFADVARRVAWMSPSLDPSSRGRPSATFAVEVYERQQVAEKRAQLDALAREHILLFFFRGDCQYCHAFAPVLKTFEQRYGLQVSAISLDGGSLPDFPNSRGDSGISQALKVAQVPALFLAHPTSGTIVPLGFGVLSENEIVERIVTVGAPQDSPRVTASPQ
jgi:conjugal transfer pilus assembly protein TraF